MSKPQSPMQGHRRQESSIEAVGARGLVDAGRLLLPHLDLASNWDVLFCRSSYRDREANRARDCELACLRKPTKQIPTLSSVLHKCYCGVPGFNGVQGVVSSNPTVPTIEQ